MGILTSDLHPIVKQDERIYSHFSFETHNTHCFRPKTLVENFLRFPNDQPNKSDTSKRTIESDTVDVDDLGDFTAENTV